MQAYTERAIIDAEQDNAKAIADWHAARTDKQGWHPVVIVIPRLTGVRQ